jgi:ankyrin repeat protein
MTAIPRVQIDFHNAIVSGKGSAILRKYVKRGADVNALSDGRTPISISAQQGRADVIRTLVGLGANVNTPTNGGATPVYTAAQVGHVNIIKILAGLGANVNTPTNNGFTPILLKRAVRVSSKL